MVAVIARSQTRDPFELTFGDLRHQVARARAGLQRLGVGRGDRVVAYLPNIPETSSPSSPPPASGNLGDVCVRVRATQRPRPARPARAYRPPRDRRLPWGDRHVDRREQVAASGPGCRRSSTSSTCRMRWPRRRIAGHARLGGAPRRAGGRRFDPVPFAHPLYVLFSSGTTGLPKAIVHGHGGILLEHCKNLGLCFDIHRGDRVLWFTTTAWMMWNALVSNLVLRASILMIDGNPGYPDLSFQWQLAEETRATFMGLSPAFTMACRRTGSSRGAASTCRRSAPCARQGHRSTRGVRLAVQQLGTDLFLNVGSGGTDVCSGLVSAYPVLPVYAGRSPLRASGGRRRVRPRRPAGGG